LLEITLHDRVDTAVVVARVRDERDRERHAVAGAP
jgi:hypothetical protein